MSKKRRIIGRIGSFISVLGFFWLACAINDDVNGAAFCNAVLSQILGGFGLMALGALIAVASKRLEIIKDSGKMHYYWLLD